MKQFWIYERGVCLAEDQDDALLKYVKKNQGFRDLQDKAARQLGDVALEKLMETLRVEEVT